MDGRGGNSIDEDSSTEEVMEKIFRFSADSLPKTEPSRILNRANRLPQPSPDAAVYSSDVLFSIVSLMTSRET